MSAYPDDFFIMVHMDGCGHCESAKPHWTKVLGKNVFWVEQNNFDQSKYEIDPPITGYPVFLHIKNKKAVSQYTGERTESAFREWISSESRAAKGGCWGSSRRRRGGRRRTRRRSRRSRRS